MKVFTSWLTETHSSFWKAAPTSGSRISCTATVVFPTPPCMYIRMQCVCVCVRARVRAHVMHTNTPTLRAHTQRHSARVSLFSPGSGIFHDGE